MLALSIRQPYAELILRGIKRIEYRSRPTRIIGERFYIYASRKWAVGGGRFDGAHHAQWAVNRERVWSNDLALAQAGDVQPWMIELANALRMFRQELPTGVIVGSAVIEKVTPGELGSRGMFHWHLTEVRRASKFRKPKGHPQPVWFEPF